MFDFGIANIWKTDDKARTKLKFLEFIMIYTFFLESKNVSIQNSDSGLD